MTAAARDAPNEREYMVMDSRAQYSTHAATVLEACGPYQPTWKELRENWGDQGAVLVYATDWDGGKYTRTIFVGVIR